MEPPDLLEDTLVDRDMLLLGPASGGINMLASVADCADPSSASASSLTFLPFFSALAFLAHLRFASNVLSRRSSSFCGRSVTVEETVRPFDKRHSTTDHCPSASYEVAAPKESRACLANAFAKSIEHVYRCTSCRNTDKER